MPLFAAMAVGAGIGALAGFAVYGAKVLFSEKRSWSWKDAGAHALGGVVGGGLFPPIMAGLAAVGLPAAAAYVLAGGISWGGIWSLAQDGASWAFGRRDGLAPASKYLTATAIGLAVSALLLPVAARTLTPASGLRPHAGTAEAYLKLPNAANLAKAEGEFLAFGALSEAGSAITEAGVALVRPSLSRAVVAPAVSRAGAPTLSRTGVDSLTQDETFASDPGELEGELGSPFGVWAAERLPTDRSSPLPFAAADEEQHGEQALLSLPGAAQALESTMTQ